MKRSLFSLLMVAMGFVTLHAQTTETETRTNKFCQNWSIGLNVGGVTPMKHSAFFGNMRPTIGLDINKQFSPIYGLTLESMYGVNTTGAPQAFDAFDLMLLHRVNLNNLFTHYKGKPSLFEVEAVAGFGWIKIFDYYPTSDGFANANHVGSKAGLNFNFNLGEKKAWTFALKPAIVWDMTIPGQAHQNFDANQAVWELTAGVTYRFKNKNGKHYYSDDCTNEDAVKALNGMISNLEQEVAAKDRALSDAQDKINGLRRDLKDCKNSRREAVKSEKQDYIVTFRQGMSNIEAAQMPYIDQLGTYLKQNENAKVVISGYASPEGKKSYNEKLAQKRADKVKDILVKKYNISSDRIEAKGMGVGSIYNDPSWNRVSVCVVK